MKRTPYIFLLALLAACTGEDRSGEVPYAPSVRTVDAVVDGGTCSFTGEVQASPNSLLTAQGFYYGNDTLRVQVLAPLTGEALFSESVAELKAGDYYVHAFATNGIGTTNGDTLRFSIL
ncbi:MAG: hypothetical protein IJ684_06795 [Bacteroidales bacterium]|nr:hypothetical protein [Alloprevotella sp.]MBR1644510.1 hypothetical protein [Bacteroidales bacterium]MBR1645059.1 hypothetical protein [Bacteroidales bacterium]